MIELKHIMKTAAELEVRSAQVEAVGKLLEEGATVPFIARYRKEATGNLDEVQIIAIRDRLEQLKALDERRAAVLKSIEEQGKLTPELKEAIEAAETLARVEDLYLPYKPKKETRADKAHFSAPDVDELRKFIQLILAQLRTQRGYTALTRNRNRGTSMSHCHGAELIHGKQVSIASHPLLPEYNRTIRHLQPYQQSHQSQQRRQQQKAKKRSRIIKDIFHQFNTFP